MLRTVELGVTDRDAAVPLAHPLQRAGSTLDTVVKARWLDEAGVPPTVQHDRHNVPLGLEAMRDFLDAGIKAAPGSDYTASPAEPMLWLRSEVTRTDASGHACP